MTKMERAIKALESLPEQQRDELADLILEVAEAANADESALTDEQWAEIDRRIARGFRPADPDAIDRLLARLA